MSRHLRIALAATLLVSLHVPSLFAQASTSYIVDRWNTDAGLPQSSVNAIMQARDGRLWLATLGGIASFDGTVFTSITTGDKTGLRSDRAHALAEDRRGRIWIGTEAGLSRYDHGAITTLTKEQGLPSEYVRTLVAHPDGSIWFGTQDGALGRVDDDAVQVIVPARGQLGTGVDDLLVDTDGAIWVSSQLGIWRMDPQTRTPSQIRPRTAIGQTPVTLSLDSGGGVWFATDAGVVLHTKSGERTFAVPATDGLIPAELRLVTSDGAGGVWLGTGRNDVWHFRPSHGSLERVDNGSGIVTALVRDREGSLWIGNRIDGLVRVRPSRFRVFTQADGLAQDNISAVFRDSSGRIWVGGQCQGAAVFEAGRFRKLADNESSGCVWTFAQDRNGDIWMGGRGTGRWHDGKFTFVDRVAGVRVLFADREGTMWVGGAQGISSWDGTKLVRRAGSDLIARPDVRTAYQGPDGALWIGMEGGLLRYADGKFTKITAAEGLPYSDVRAIYHDTGGTIWIGTYGGGLIHFRDGKYTSVRTTDGLLDNFLSTIVEDSGNFWLSSNRGLFRVTRQELEEFVAGRIKRVHAIAYGRADGMGSAETNGGFTPAVMRTPDGRLWYPTLVGIAVIDPAAAVTAIAPTIAVENVLVNGRPVPVGEEIDVGPGADDVELRYVGLSLSAPNAVTFQYRLENWDRDWVDAGTRRSVNYSRLPPGRYRFRVSAANREGARSDEAALTLMVLPHFWQTWWFRSLALLAIVAVPIVGDRRHRQRQAELTRLVDQKTHELREQKTEIEQQARELLKQNEILAENVRLKDDVDRISRHDLRTPLTSIISLAQIVREGGDLPAQYDASIKLIEQAGYRAMNLATLTLDLFKMEQGTYRLTPATVDLREEVDRVLSDLQPVLRTRQVTCEVTTDPGDGDRFLVYGDDLLSYAMLSNLIKNAVEATPSGGRVSIGIAHHADSVRVRIHNPGAIPRALRERFFEKYATAGKKGGTGLGAYSARLMAETQGGTIRVNTSDEEGTAITIELPSSTASPAAAAPVVDDAPLVAQSTEAWPSRTLLVVDDDENNRVILRHFLRHPRWIVDEAENGPLALRKISEKAYDVVFLDVEMPVMDGLEVAARIRQSGVAPRLLVIGLSSHDDPDTKARALAAGCDQYFTKPVTRQTMVDIVLGASSGPVAVDPDIAALLPALLRKQQEEIHHLESAIAANDAEGLRQVSHRMRGSLALYGVKDAAAVCAEIEELAQSNRLPDAAERLPALASLLKDAIRRV